MEKIDFEDWRNTERLYPYRYKCGYCGQTVGANYGYTVNHYNDDYAMLLIIKRLKIRAMHNEF